jgi:hypothetical protein
MGRGACQELLDLVDDGVGVSDERDVIVTGQLDERRIRDRLAEVAALVDRDDAIAGAVKHERRRLDRR